MKDRKALLEEQNRIKRLYAEKDLEIAKKFPDDYAARQKMRDMYNAKNNSLIAEMGDDLQKLNAGGAVKIAGNAPKSTTGKIASKLTGKLPFGKLMKVLGPIGLAAGTAADAMASGDLGAGEDLELEKIKREIELSKNPKLMEIKTKMDELAAKPVSAVDMLNKPPVSMMEELGQRDSQDYESGLSPEIEIARRKKQLGY